MRLGAWGGGVREGQEAGVKVGRVGLREDDPGETWKSGVSGGRQERASETSPVGKAGPLGPAPRLPRSTRGRQVRGTQGPRTVAREDIALDKAQALVESRISSTLPTLSEFTPGHGHLIF